MVDLDDFKHINDEHGHVVGDRVLKCAAAALAEGIREEDFVARYGGEEFALMLAGTSLKQAQERLSALVQRIGPLATSTNSSAKTIWFTSPSAPDSRSSRKATRRKSS